MMTFLLFASARTKWLGWRKSRKSQREFLRVCVLWHHNKQINLVCQTQIINGVDRLDPTDHKYLKVKRVKFNEKTGSWNYEVVRNFELPPPVPFKFIITDIDKEESFTNVEIISIAIFHASSVGLRYSLVFICFSFFISIELVTKRNRYICGSICLMLQMTATGSLLPIFRPGLFLD